MPMDDGLFTVKELFAFNGSITQRYLSACRAACFFFYDVPIGREREREIDVSNGGFIQKKFYTDVFIELLFKTD